MINLNQIKNIIDRYDPINLNPNEVSPDDEYLSEAKIINGMVSNIINEETFYHNIKRLFIERFSESVVDVKKLDIMSKELYFLFINSNKK